MRLSKINVHVGGDDVILIFGINGSGVLGRDV
jgi:hypothetical protein